MWLPRRREERNGMDWEFGVGRCKLLHVEWISNEVLLYSIGKYIQSLGIDHDGGLYKKGNTHTHTHTHTHSDPKWLGHFAVQQKLAQHCKSIIL